MKFARLFVFMILAVAIIASGPAHAADKAAGSSQWTLGAGGVLPNEGDLDAGWALSLGYKFQMDKDIMFLDLMYAQTGVNVAAGPLAGADVDHNILNLGYMTPLNGRQSLRVGAGVSLHQMDIGTAGKMTKMTPMSVLEYDLSDRWSVRLQSATPGKKNQVRFGNAIAAMLQWNL